jgi:hypothetical protein
MPRIAFVIVLGCIFCAACANAIVRPLAGPAAPATDALLVLPGFGYGGTGEDTFRMLAGAVAADGIDFYLPVYISRSGLGDSREQLRRFIRDNRLDRYARVHVLAFLAGGWTLNPMVEAGALPNLSTIVYDRSPYQERAPRIASSKLRFLSWVRYGPVLFDVARTPYPTVPLSGVRVGLMVETAPTPFVQRFAKSASAYGPYQFECDAFGQRFDDCFYVAMNHDEIYARFAEVWPEVRSFIHGGRFTAAANRTPPAASAMPGGRQ